MSQEHHTVFGVVRGEGAAVPPTGSDDAIIRDDANDARAASGLYDRIAGLFVDDSFAEEVDAYIQAHRQRERDEAAREAESTRGFAPHCRAWAQKVGASRL